MTQENDVKRPIQELELDPVQKLKPSRITRRKK